MWSEIISFQKKIKEHREGNSSGSSSDTIINQGFGGEVILENSPVGESQANGMVEKAIQDVQGYIRALKFQLEKRIGCKIVSSNPIWAWIIDYASKVYRNFHIHTSDKKTTAQRIRGDAPMHTIVEFGESVLLEASKHSCYRQMH